MEEKKNTPKPIITGRAILVLGPSGRGKSTSLRNLVPTETLVINTERKTLPWKGGAAWPQVKPKTVKELFDLLDKYHNNVNIKQVVIDSFSAFSDMLVHEAKIVKTGWDVWTYYNTYMYDFFQKLKKFTDSGKHVIAIGHDETIVDEEGSGERRLKTKGKEWSGVTEKEFDIVFYAHAELVDETTTNYTFITQNTGKLPSKTPMGMFDSFKIPNDMAEAIKIIDAYDGR